MSSMAGSLTTAIASTANAASRTLTSTTAAVQQRPQTPQPAQPAQQQVKPFQQKPSTPQQPGMWRHPHFDEITRRQNATVFNGDSVNRIVLNAALLLLSMFAPSVLQSYTPAAALKLVAPLQPYEAYSLLALRALFLVNILLTLLPLLRTKDDVVDIPLTPSQRALLGLRPSNAPLTPGEQYITPPRYARSSTPRSNASSRSNAGSPLSGSPLMGRDGSPASMDRSMAYTASPLVQKALGASTARRLSFDSGSSGLPSTPTPSLGTGKASVGLNNKWLYERGRGSPSGRNLFS